MHLSLFIKGIIVGFVIAVPVGPVNILCIHRTLTIGRRSGFVSGLGAAIADTIFGIVAALGLTLIKDVLIEQQTWLRMFGGMFIVAIGAGALFSPRRRKERKPRLWHARMAGDFGSAFALTITNPITIVSFAAIFAAANAVVPDNDWSAAGALILGVFLGSQLWWTILTLGSGTFRHRIGEDGLIRLSRISGVVIIACGIIVFLSVIPPFNEIFVF